jgi:hypothetical protein
MKIKRPPVRRLPDPAESTRNVVAAILACPDDDSLLQALHDIEEVVKCKDDFYHWIEVMDRFDVVLEKGLPSTAEDSAVHPPLSVIEAYDSGQSTPLVIEVLRVSCLIIDSCASRNLSLYNSLASLMAMTMCDSLALVTGALEVFVALGRHRRRLDAAKERDLQFRLTVYALTWSEPSQAFNLVQCVMDDMSAFPKYMHHLKFGFYLSASDAAAAIEVAAASGLGKTYPAGLTTILIENLRETTRETPLQILQRLVKEYGVPHKYQFELLSAIRLAQSFPNLLERQQCVRVKLLALSALVLSRPDDMALLQIFQADTNLVQDLIAMSMSTDKAPVLLCCTGLCVIQAFVQTQIK